MFLVNFIYSVCPLSICICLVILHVCNLLPSCVVNKLMYSVLIINFQGDLLSKFFNFMRIDIR